MHARLVQTNLPGIPLLARGKVRDIYDLGETLLIVATDRISAFDVVMPQAIPDKGRVLTQMSLFWFEFLKDVIESHLITADIGEFPAALRPFADQLEGRSMVVKRAEVLPVECLVRGYVVLSGAGWKEYHERGSISGIKLPPNLPDAQQLEEPIFTPTTKAQTGLHDENITPAEAAKVIGAEALEFIRSKSIAIYQKAADYRARPRDYHRGHQVRVRAF